MEDGMSPVPNDISAPKGTRSRDIGDRLACAAVVIAVIAAFVLGIPFIAAIPWPR
jgi:hypothetical protein